MLPRSSASKLASEPANDLDERGEGIEQLDGLPALSESNRQLPTPGPQRDVARELRQRRSALNLRLVDVGAAAGITPAHLSMIERGERMPSLDVLGKLQRALGLVPELPAELVGVIHRPAGDEVLSLLGAMLVTLTDCPLDLMARAADLERGEVRQALRQLSAHLAPIGIVVVDDGSTARLGPRPELQDQLSLVGEPEVLPPLTGAQAEVLAICVGLGLVTRSRIESIRGVDTADVLAVLVRRGLLECEHDDDSVGRPLVYRPTAKLLHVSNVETVEDLRVQMGLPPNGVTGSGLQQ